MTIFVDTIILGCGPSGLQLGYFLKQINEKYLILEKNSSPGSFFSKYPHSNELISINKKYTGYNNKEFNLRHDWNSLLNNFEIQMKDFSNSYYPSRDELVEYFNNFAEKHQLNITYNTCIKNIVKRDNIFYLSSDKDNIWSCKNLVIATGLSKPNIPNIVNVELYSKHYSEYPINYFLKSENLNYYKNKKVLVLGQGNSAFELANMLTPYCSTIVILGRGHYPIPAISTHYTGDLRSKYFNFYDTFLLKSLNAFDAFDRDKKNIAISKHKNNLLYIEKNCECHCPYYMEPNIGFHEIINCTGWLFDDSIFDISTKPKIYRKYPEIYGNYESTNINNLFFIGSLMHSFDYKKSSGGFIHGFRYLIDNFVKINYTNFIPLLFNTISSVSLYIVKRINISSALYQMHGQLCDVFFKDTDKFLYYEEIPLSYLLSLSNTKIQLTNTYIFILTLEYGNHTESDLKKIGSAQSELGSESKAVLLHPVLRVFDNKNNKFGNNYIFYPSHNNILNQPGLVEIFHFDEDLITNFTNKEKYLKKIFKRIKSYIK